MAALLLLLLLVLLPSESLSIRLFVNALSADVDDCESCLEIPHNLWCESTRDCQTRRSIRREGWRCEEEPFGWIAHLADCPLGSSNSNNDGTRSPPSSYNDTLARRVMTPMLAAAHTNSAQETTHCLHNQKHVRQMQVLAWERVSCSPSSDMFRSLHVPLRMTCQGYLAYDNQSGTAVLAFAGTQQPIHIVEQFTQLESRHYDDGHVLGVHILRSYSEALQRLFLNGQLREKTELLMSERPKARLLLFGYSLGGAIASAVALWLRLHGDVDAHRMTLYTIGQPRTGDAQFAALVRSEIPDAFRIQHYRDPVPSVPERSRHAAHPLYHFPRHIRYNEEMTEWTTCLRADLDTCDGTMSVGHWTSKEDMNMHAMYFDMNVASYYAHCSCIC